jgi:hypothetical protein
VSSFFCEPIFYWGSRYFSYSIYGLNCTETGNIVNIYDIQEVKKTLRGLVKTLTGYFKIFLWTSFLMVFGLVIIMTLVMESLVQLAR